ncbi:MAG: peptidoglycan DD-metalloendopeptidase family protein [Patescibacteria group bacterium]
MLKRVLITVTLLVFCAVSALASMPISSPWGAGDKWMGGYFGDDPKMPSYYGDNLHVGNSYYAIDFNLNWSANAASTQDQGYPILCVANGTVVFAGWKTGFGNCVEVDHGTYNGKKVTTFYAHFQDGKPIAVKVGEKVLKGQVLGFCGQSGGTSTGNHLHFELREDGKSVPITSMDGYKWCDGSTCDGHILESKNANLFDREFSANGGSYLGSKNGSIHWWHGWDPNDLYGTQNTARRCYIQDYNGGSWGACAIAYDGLGGGRKAFTVRTGFWYTGYGNGWSERNGPKGDLGMPITNEYANGTNAARQDFQRGYLHYKLRRTPREVTVNLYPVCAPGMTSAGWNPVISYKIARSYELGGARNTYGEATGYAYKVSGTTTWRQYFSSGKRIDVGEAATVSTASENPVQPEPNQAAQVVLFQNHPNPFNPQTSISFSLSEKSLVSLKVYNVSGQEIATLAEGEKDAGQHSIVWDASGCASGIYFCRLQVGQIVQTRKMVLLR